MADLINGEFEFGGVTFGTQRSGYPLVPGGYSVGNVQFRTQDSDLPGDDGRVFGEDLVSGVTHTWQLLALADGGDPWGEVVLAASALRSLWHAKDHRLSRQAKWLRLWHGDRVYRVVGRPRNFAVDRAQVRKGLARITMDFVTVDDLSYSDAEYGLTIGLVTNSVGGLKAPLVAPLTSAGVASSRPGMFKVGGNTATGLAVRFQGPVVNPRVRIDDRLTVGWNGTIPYDGTVTIDAKRWSRSVYRQDGTFVGGGMSPDTPPMAELVLHPGDHEMVFTGHDPSATASATILWRDALRSI